MRLSLNESMPGQHSARPGWGWARSSAVGQSSRFEWPPAYPSSAPSTARSVVASVEVDAPADMPHDKPSSNGLPRGWGGLGKIQGGRCVSVEQVQMLGGAPVHRLALRDSIDCRGQLRSR